MQTVTIVLLSVLTLVNANLHDAIDTYIVQTEYGNIRGYSKLVLGRHLRSREKDREDNTFF